MTDHNEIVIPEPWEFDDIDDEAELAALDARDAARIEKHNIRLPDWLAATLQGVDVNSTVGTICDEVTEMLSSAMTFKGDPDGGPPWGPDCFAARYHLMNVRWQVADDLDAAMRAAHLFAGLSRLLSDAVAEYRVEPWVYEE